MQNGDFVCVSAPGRLILFGEHAVGLGGPAVAIAVDLRIRCKAQLAPRFTVNGEDLDPVKHPLVRAAVLHGWPDMDRPLAFTIESDVPDGFGGEASTIVACLGAMSMLHDHIIYEHVARSAFLASCEAVAGLDPLDTSAATHGSGVFIGHDAGERILWTIIDGNRSWQVGGLKLPEMGLVLGFANAGKPQDVRGKVARYCERNSFARDIVRDIGDIALEGFAALDDGNLQKVGEQMNRNQRLLANLGASDQAADRLLAAVSRHSYGAKVTGYNSGTVLALAREPEKAMRAIGDAGGKAMLVVPAGDGVRPDD